MFAVNDYLTESAFSILVVSVSQDYFAVSFPERQVLDNLKITMTLCCCDCVNK